MTEEEWLKCERLWDMTHCVRGKISDREGRLFAAACCRRIWDFISDEQSRQAVETTELYVDGRATRKQLIKARSQAAVIARAVHTKWTPARSAAWVASTGASGRAVEAAISVVRSVAADQAWKKIEPAKGVDAADSAARAAEREAIEIEHRRLAILLRHIIGNPFRPYPAPPS